MAPSPLSLIRESKLKDAQELLVANVRRQPDNIDHRYNLVGVLAFAGEFDRALTHLSAIAELRPELLPVASAYSAMLQAEEERRRCHEGTHSPAVDGESTDTAKRVALLVASRRGDVAEASRLMAACCPPTRIARVPPHADGALRDADDVLGDTLEVFSAGRYLWMPLSSIRRLDFVPAKGLLDLVWAQCAIERVDGRKYTVHVPVLYAGTSGHPDPAVRCGHKTEWVDSCGVAFRGFGQRILMVGDVEVPLLTARTVEFAN